MDIDRLTRIAHDAGDLTIRLGLRGGAQETARDIAVAVAAAVRAEVLESITPAMMAEAMQFAWDDHCDDTGGHPGIFRKRGKLSYADFSAGNFAVSVTHALSDRIRALSTSARAEGNDRG